MQLHLALTTFQYENSHSVRTVMIDGEPWFYGIDACKVLDLANSGNAYSRLEKDDIRTVDVVDSKGKKQEIYVLSEYGLYDLVLLSRKDEAKRFKRWITHEVIPQIRKTGAYSVAPGSIPIFVRRFNDNWDRVSSGYFSVISELFIRVYGRFEQVGYIMKEHGLDGREIRPDVSVGQRFSKWLKKYHPEHVDRRRKYSHLLPDGKEVEAFQYPLDMLGLFIEYVETVWLRDHAPTYLGERDPAALEYLPKLLPATPKKANSQ